jgi:riboflavin transporter FmnP
MIKLFISLGIGAAAGIIDIIPMIIQKLDKFSNWSAFVHWLVLGVVISYIQLPMSPWLKGLVVAEISALPIIILMLKNDPKSIIPILVMSAILGIAVGVATNKFA